MAEGLGHAALTVRLGERADAVHKHIRSNFTKIDLPPSGETDRRVVAVLRYLEAF